ncbi:hypothetical protein GCM10010435_76450 [Winogradskya consettensis]|uniref:Polyketide cyclase / dehydrase and lipid transport n=1 Tax=Winogradskya consettensis TaxID=113560 RepID=A0A919SMW6_9ACTN|nr:SRPBCC family protein [Actinoplanes consettensis]GIM74511.1 hypothetical protein Aco04nite_40660 [Actinoplanes consettensis]
MPSQTLSRTARISAPPAKIYAHLSDPQSYLGLSPLLVDIRDVRPHPGGVAYTAVERFRYGVFTWDNPIAVTMTFQAPETRIVSDVRSPARVHLISTVDLTPVPEGTDLTETIHVTYPPLLGRFVVGQATAVQQHRLAELTRRMSQPR